MKRNLQSAGLSANCKQRAVGSNTKHFLFPLQIEIECGIIKNLRKYYWSLMPGSARGLPGHLVKGNGHCGHLPVGIFRATGGTGIGF